MNRAKALRMAQSIVNGFDAFFADYLNLTLGAHLRFENAAWSEVQLAQQRRQMLYEEKIQQVVELARHTVGDFLHEPDLWLEVKKQFIPLIQGHRNIEVVESFYNSVYCYVFQHKVIRDSHAFAQLSTAPLVTAPDSGIYRQYYSHDDTAKLVADIVQDCGFEPAFFDLTRDCDLVAKAFETEVLPALPEGVQREEIIFEVLQSLFYRNKGAYIVGRLLVRGRLIPLLIPVLHNEAGQLYLDAVLFDVSDISIVFSFTRAYFMVYTDQPSQYVAFLRSIMPHKEKFEMYAAIGFPKHAKTEFVRRSVARIKQSDDKFEIAPGIKGMVMLVFTLPSYEYVFKVIKDRFTPPKSMTRDQVKAKYDLVKLHDRAGRMADTQEFTNLVFDRFRFSEELIDELRREVPSLLEMKGNVLLLKHCYVERRMTPLNLFLPGKDDDVLRATMDEYGKAIKQLSAANIFPGDMLLKNFGVTRHGRVVFYDYDEICLMTECNFRKIPEPKTEEQEMASTPWYSVADNDVFPEEFRLFFSGNNDARKVFEEMHGDLYDYRYWQAMQQRILDGEVADVYPYSNSRRFRP